MIVGLIFTEIGNFIANRQIFIVLNCNCTKLANFEDYLNMLRGPFLLTQCICQPALGNIPSQELKDFVRAMLNYLDVIAHSN